MMARHDESTVDLRGFPDGAIHAIGLVGSDRRDEAPELWRRLLGAAATERLRREQGGTGPVPVQLPDELDGDGLLDASIELLILAAVLERAARAGWTDQVGDAVQQLYRLAREAEIRRALLEMPEGEQH